MSRAAVRALLREATLAALGDAVATVSGGNLYAVALTTDDGGTSPEVCLSTLPDSTRPS